MIDDLRGRMVDLDSHLMLFPREAEEILGPGPDGGVWRSRGGGPSLVDEIRQMVLEEGVDPSGSGEALEARRRKARDDVWAIRHWGAHGAQIAADRVDALDQLGIGRQFLFSQFMEPPLNADCPEGAAAVARYNDYVLSWAEGVSDRVLPVCMLNTHDVDVALAEARRVLEKGAQGLHFGGVVPPAGKSPAAPDWDPLWAMLAEAKVPALLHFGGSGGFRPTIDFSWYLASWALCPPESDPDAKNFHSRPFFWMTTHLYAELTLTFMVLGGVFERHPDLRFAVVESGASWVAPWCARMDNVASTVSRYLSRTLPLKPSEYVRRQVRVTPFEFEPVGTWIEQSGLEEVYVFSTDYPHAEGGENPIDAFTATLEPLGDKVVERFFVTNGAELLHG